MAKKFLDYSGLERFLDKIKSWSKGAFAVKSVNGVDLHSMVVDKTNGTTFGSMKGKTIQQLRDAIDMWHAENAGKENASLKFSANNNFIGLWNENNLEQTLSSGTTWTLTATNNITTEHSTFQLSTYSNGHELYTTKKLNGVWQSIEKVAKNKSISKSASNKGVSVALGGTVESPTISVTTTTSGVASNNTGVVSGSEVKSYVDTNAASTATFKAATSSSTAVNGLVPAPSSANTTKFLRGDGTWQIPSVAEKLGTSTVGSTKKPIYLNNGTATPISYTIEKSVPSDAVFTDTHYTAKNIVSNSAGGIETAAAVNGEVHINLVENGTWRSGINIIGSGATLVTSDAYGNITITSEDTNTTYVAMKGATSSNDGASGLVPKPLKTQQEYLLRGDGTWTNRITEFGPTGSVNIGRNYSNAIGWFRIVKSRHARSRPSAFRLILTRNYSTAAPECYVFDVVTSYHSYDPISITQVAGQASTVDGNKLIEKIRVVRDESANNTFIYLDFYVGVEKTGNTCYWSVEGNATSLVGSEVLYNPELSDTDRVFEFDTVNGFKTNGDIEGDSRFRSKMRSNPQTSSGVMFDTAPMLINGLIPYSATEIVEAPDGNPDNGNYSTSLLSKVYLSSSYSVYNQDEILYFTPGETIKAECWIRRNVGADTGKTNGIFYFGVKFKDKKGHPVNNNAGTVYFPSMSGYTCPCDGQWHHLVGEYTIPTTHTPYVIKDTSTGNVISQSDGGGYYSGSILSEVNSKLTSTAANGNIPTYIAGLRITKVAPSASATNKGIQIKLDGSPYTPTPTIVVTTSGVSAANTGVVSGAEVKEYVDANKGVNTVFKAQTSSSNAVNGLVPAPSSANATKYLRGDGTWQTPTDTTYDVVTSSVAGLTPKIGTAAASTIETQSTEWVLASTNGGTPSWRKLPTNAFNNAREFVGDYTYDLGSFYNYTNGCLIEIGTASGATMVAIHVTGNGYGATKPINSMYQFYDNNASNGITNGGAICLGASTGDMVVYRYNNKVYAWIKQQREFQTLSFRLYTNKSALSPVVTNAAAHTSGISNKITISTSGIYAGQNTTTPNWSNSTDARKGIELLQTVGSEPTSGSAPSNYSVGLRVSGYYSFMLANDISNNAMRCYRNSTNGWETFITDKNIESYTKGTMKWGGIVSTAVYAKDYPVGTVLKANTEESLYILKGSELVSTSVALGTNLIVSHETYTSGTANTSGNVFLEF